MTQQITLDAVDSSQIYGIAHNAQYSILVICFRGKDGGPGSVYHYRNFTAEDFAAFKDAESIGSHFYKNIKPFPDKYPYTKIEAAQPVEQA